MAEPAITVGRYEAEAALPPDMGLFNRGTNTLLTETGRTVEPDGTIVSAVDVRASMMNLAYNVDIRFAPDGTPLSIDLTNQEEAFSQNHRDMVTGAIEEWDKFRADTPFERDDYSRDNPGTSIERAMVEQGRAPFDQGGVLPRDDIFRRNFSDETGRLDIESCTLVPGQSAEPQAALCISNIFNEATGTMAQQLSLHALVDNNLASLTGPEVGREWLVDNANNDTQIYNENVDSAVDKGDVSFGLRQPF